MTHDMVRVTHSLQDLANELRQKISDFDDFFRPLRTYFYWEKHCYDIPVCFALKGVFDRIDMGDEISR